MSTLPAQLRRQLERAALDARNIAEAGARKALEALAVHEPDPYKHMDEAQRNHRRKLRAQARQLGDGESQTKRGAYEIKHLVEKTAYDQWHRLLFARFLLENNLLISPEHGVSVSLDDCEELAPSLGLKDAWAVAARFAAKELPEIFRADDPAGAVEMPVEDRKQLVQLVRNLPVEVFTAGDSLGWCYQFWQAERKDEVNAAGNKIGADELPAVTQLFTEDYMVDFLLDNTLGAWHAAKQFTNADLRFTIESEEAARQAVALPGCPWKYLRFIKGADGKWTPAAGSFDGWPKTVKELKCLDPCMGSGHFVVAMFERLVALRMAEEKLDEKAAVAAVIRDNLFGLELDPRCTQIGAFSLALAAWRRVGYCALPAMHIACSGLAPNTREADWLKLAGDNQKLQRGMERLYRLFQKAAVLGSLINPRAGEGDLLVAAFHELQPLLEKALAQEAKDDTAHEMAVTARGLAKAAEILAGQFTLVATNVPYLGRGKQEDVLQDYCGRFYPDGKGDLATCFVIRCLEFCTEGIGSTALVAPQNWLTQSSYDKYRSRILRDATLKIVARLGPKAFQTPMWDFNVQLLVIGNTPPIAAWLLRGLDTSSPNDIEQKAAMLREVEIVAVNQISQITNPDSRISFAMPSNYPPIGKLCSALMGSGAGDRIRFVRNFWEVLPGAGDVWEFHQTTPSRTEPFAGREEVILWEHEKGQMFQLAESVKHLNHKAQQWRSGKPNWGKRGVVVSLMANLPATLYTGEIYATKCTAIVPSEENQSVLLALWAFCSSEEFVTSVREINQRLAIEVKEVLQVPFDLAHWQKVAAEKYPHGLPMPFSSDPTQWLFNGHPKDATPDGSGLQVAVARLLGYQWPRQTGSNFPDCPALGSDGLDKIADEDGIVPISPAKGEGPAAERLRELLARAYGKEWNATKHTELLAQVGYAGATMEDWLRNGFFEQHCALFHHRPFIWHIWDGHKNGFSALVNYHKLTHANLEKLTFSYLGDWIRRQQAAVEAEEAGSDARLQAAKQLQSALKLILEGEGDPAAGTGYDIFVRWKGLAAQAIGWQPDLNDGVRMNIRPFATADILRKRVKIKWDKDRGKEPQRDKKDFPWFWNGSAFTGDRVNDVHLTREQKERARK